MTMTYWIDEISGVRLAAHELIRRRRQASEVYLRNTHIFEDEVEALAALGVVPLERAGSPRDAADGRQGRTTPAAVAARTPVRGRCRSR